MLIECVCKLQVIYTELCSGFMELYSLYSWQSGDTGDRARHSSHGTKDGVGGSHLGVSPKSFMWGIQQTQGTLEITSVCRLPWAREFNGVSFKAWVSRVMWGGKMPKRACRGSGCLAAGKSVT